MLALLLSSFFALFFFITFGIIFSKFIGNSKNYLELTLVGLVISNTITSFLSLFFPINIFVFGLFILGCLIFFFFIRKEIKSLISLLIEKKTIIIFSLPFILLAFFISLVPPSNYDTGLYHLQSIKWIEEYSVIPGLANLHGRFGYNPNIFTLFSLTSLSKIFNQEIFSINLSVFAILIIYFINKMYSLFKKEGLSNLFLFYAFLFYTILKLHGNLSSPTPDFISTTIIFFIFARILDISNQKEKIELKSYIPILILGIYIITVKLATIPIILLFVFVFIKYKSEIKKVLWMIPVLSIIILPWLIRNIILSGWLIYPFPTLDLFSFDWKVPLQNVIGEKIAITGWAREAGANFLAAANKNFLSWFPIWWNNCDLTVKLYFSLSLIFPLIILVGHLTKKIKFDFFANIILITSFFGVLFWLFMAPSFRFGQSFIVIAAISPLLYLKFNLLQNKIVYSVIIIALLVNFTRMTINNYKSIFLKENLLLRPQKIAIPNNISFKVNKIDGLDVYIPTDGDRCYDHKIPCTTPYFDSSISLRGETIKSGFKHIP